MNIKINNTFLSKEQTIPIIENPKISMIIAGAGSGKTLTIIGKIKYMLDNKLIKPQEICLITYTNKAVDSLINKISDITTSNINVFTFHKLALTILSKINTNYYIYNIDYLEYIIDEFFITKAFNNDLLLKYIYNYFNIFFIKTNKRYKKILNSQKYFNFKKSIISFINYMKSNDLYNKFLSILNNKNYKKELLIIYAIYNIYENELISSNSLDFDKMIELATNAIKDKKVRLPYKLIIIDEFQDSSLLRFNLVKEIVKKNNASLCVVGDDYQSIYSFQGCDLNLFINFKSVYNNAKIYYLNETFRNSQELIDIAGNFIKKNPNQIKKNLYSKKNIENPINIIYYKKEKEIIFKLLKSIDIKKEILILGRNNFDIKYYLSKYTINNSKLIILNDKHNIKYLTIHSSKGLESDCVIILNLKNDKYGLPSKIKENEILLNIKNKEEFKYAEERRLFYVALTRTKGYVYLLTPYNKESIFIKEIKKESNVLIKHY